MHNLRFALLSFSLLALVACQKSRPVRYPLSPKRPVKDTLHGRVITDRFRWLEDMQSKETKDWIAAQDSLLKAYLRDDELRNSVKKRVTELNSYPLYSSPIKRGDNYYYLQTPAGKSIPVLYWQKGAAGVPQVLLDIERRHSSGVTTSGINLSENGTGMSYGINSQGSRWITLHATSLVNNQLAENEDVIENLHALGGAPAWVTDGTGFYYVRFNAPDQSNLREAKPENAAVYYHRLGTRQAEDKLIYQERSVGNWLYQLTTTEDGKYLVIDVRKGSASNNRIIVKEIQMDFQRDIHLLNNGNFSFLGNDEEELFFYTTTGAPNGKIDGINLKTRKLHNIIPEAVDPISGNSLVGGNAIGFFGGKFMVTYIKDGVPYLKGFERNGQLAYRTGLPIDGSIWGGFSGSQKDTHIFYRFLGFTSPSTIYRIDVSTGEASVFKSSEVKFDKELYITQQVFYTSKGGTRVPMFITHRKGIALRGNNPTIMYAYGAFSWISFLWYQEHLLLWLEKGGVYAQPSIRGGGEYGEQWHQSGIGKNRQNAVDDYLAAAQWLIDNKYTSSKRLVANGGSLSSPLASMAVIQRPDLFGAFVVDRPAFDMLRYTKFTGGSNWTSELGDPANPAEFESVYQQSPYHQLDSTKCFPPTMIMVGDLDQVTPPAHAYKFTAALQSTNTCNPILLKMMWGAGHSFGSTREQVIDSRTDELLFLMISLQLHHRSD